MNHDAHESSESPATTRPQNVPPPTESPGGRILIYSTPTSTISPSPDNPHSLLTPHEAHSAAPDLHPVALNDARGPVQGQDAIDAQDAARVVTGPLYRRPTQRQLEVIEISELDLVSENHHHGCHSKYEFNLLNLRAYVDNWSVLHPTMQRTLQAFMESDLEGNNLKQGMKRWGEFHQHLLLLIGCEIWNIREYLNTNMVLSNLRQRDGNYPKEWTKSRIIDARTCRQAAFAFEHDYDVEKLFQDFDAWIICFEADQSYRYVPEANEVKRDSYKKFFEQNSACLKQWTRAKRIYSYIYSHEVSCDSILGMQFRPHTHAVVFVPKGIPLPDLAGKMNHDDRSLKSMENAHTRYETLKNFVHYLHGAYSLAPIYRKEYTDEGVVDLNRKTVQALRTILEMAGGTRDEPPYKRFNCSYIPKRNEDARYDHPLLKKKKGK